MIARVGVFEGSPDRFKDGSYVWVKEAVEQVPGFKGLLHLTGVDGTGRALSISLWDDEESATAGDAAVRKKREEVGVSPAPPTGVEMYDVVEYE